MEQRENMTRVIYLDGATALKQSWFKEFFIKWSNRGYDIRLKFGSKDDK
jgi:hypothetical protein